MGQYRFTEKQLKKGKFLLGSLPYFAENPLNFMHEIQRFGDIVRTKFGPNNMVFVFHPDAFEAVLQVKNKHFLKSKFNVPIRHVLGKGLVSSEGKQWARDRRIIAPIFQNAMLTAHFDVIKKITNEKFKEWSSLDPSKYHDFSTDFSDYTIKVIAHAMFSSHLPEHIRVLVEEMPFLLGHLDHWNRSIIKFHPKIPTPHNIKLRRSLKRIADVSDYYLHRQKKDPDSYNNLLSELLKARDDEGKPLSDIDIRDQVSTFLISGHETTALALAWTLYLMSIYPDHVERVRKDLEIFPDVLNLELSDLDKMDSLEEFIMESMRMFPASWIIDRGCIEDVDLMGVPIKKGDIIVLSTHNLHHDPRFWDRPELFNPSRFNKKDRPNDHYNYTYIPFGLGPRTCVARKFAMIELKLCLAAMFKHFEVDLAPYPEIEKHPLLTMRAKHGVWAKLRNRT